MNDLGPLRPLAQQIPRREPGALVFALADREVRIEGEPTEAWAVLELCDGERTVEQIAAERGEDARDLVGELLREGVLVDCTQAWRLLHARASAGSTFFRELDDEQLAALGAEAYRPPAPLERTLELDAAPTSVAALAGRRHSALPGTPRQPELAELAALLSAMYGAGGDDGARPVPSAGGLYPLILHLAVRERLGELEPGLWWYDPAAEALGLIRPGPPDLRAVVLSHPISDALLGSGAPVIFLSADFERPSRKYANRGYRYGLMDAGAAMQNAYLAATELELPIRAIGGIHDAAAGALLGLGDGQAALLALIVGR